ncbi:MAG TPA: acetylxylan esterase [Planctomycetota bacterium]|nr:acetylxylan esterase [Planctomycetota bacterium]
MRGALFALVSVLLLPQDGIRTGVSKSGRLVGRTEALSRYEIPPGPFEWKLTPRTDPPEERAFDLTFPSAVKGDIEENNTVWCRVWMPKETAPTPRPAVVMLHYLKGTFKPMEAAGLFFAAKGFVAVLVYMPHYGRRRAADPEKRSFMISEDLDSTLANFRQAVLDIRRTGDWLRSQKGIDPTRIGLFGVSLGGVVGALVAGVEPRFTRTVLVVGGGDLPAMVLHESRETREMRQRLLDGGWTAEKLKPILEPIEPLTFAGRVDPGSVLLINAENDDVIPKECTERLWIAMGGPRINWIKANHYSIAFALPQILNQSAEHLAARPTW